MAIRCCNFSQWLWSIFIYVLYNNVSSTFVSTSSHVIRWNDSGVISKMKRFVDHSSTWLNLSWKKTSLSYYDLNTKIFDIDLPSFPLLASVDLPRSLNHLTMIRRNPIEIRFLALFSSEILQKNKTLLTNLHNQNVFI